MADFVKKSDTSFRVNHPDFGDVYRCHYKVGVITQLKTAYPNTPEPVSMRSFAKVSLDDATTDYLPIWFHPKSKFWDFRYWLDGAYVYFTAGNIKPDGEIECAWMSFRPGDEVAVLCREGIPVAVMGHADNYPRVGEDILRFCTVMEPEATGFPSPPPGTKQWFHYQFSNGLAYYTADEHAEIQPGPDGYPLTLTQECEKITSKEETTTETTVTTGIEDRGRLNETTICGFWNYTRTEVLTRKFFFYEWIVPIGPMLHVLAFKQVKVLSDEVTRSWDTPISPFDPCPPAVETSNTGPQNITYPNVAISSAFYTPNLYETVKNISQTSSKTAKEAWDAGGIGTAWGNEYPDFTFASGTSTYFYYWLQNNWAMGNDGVKFLVQPHNPPKAS